MEHQLAASSLMEQRLTLRFFCSSKQVPRSLASAYRPAQVCFSLLGPMSPPSPSTAARTRRLRERLLQAGRIRISVLVCQISTSTPPILLLRIKEVRFSSEEPTPAQRPQHLVVSVALKNLQPLGKPADSLNFSRVQTVARWRAGLTLAPPEPPPSRAR